MKLPLVSYRPDDDPTQPGIITSGNGFVAVERGIKAAPTPVSTLLPALTGACRGAHLANKLDGTTRFFAATATKLYEASITVWTDRSSGGGSYSTVNDRWRFTQFGDVTVAASKQNLLQVSTTGAFAPIAGSIRADIVETVGLFVLAFNTDDTAGVGLYGDRPHSWWCSGLSNHTTWTPNIATQAATGILTSVNGKITAAKRFGTQVVVYKRDGMYLGQYAGPPFIWEFLDIPSDTGTWCQESVVSIGTPEQPKHFFVGRNDFYVFDGGRPVPVGQGVRETFFRELNTQEADQICLLHDRNEASVYVFYPKGSSTIPNAALVWHYNDGRWGVDNRTIEYATEYSAQSLTYGDLGTYYSTYGSLPNSPYGEAFISVASSIPAIFNSSHVVQTLNGSASLGHIISGDYGDDINYGLLRRVKPTWLQKPTSASLSTFGRRNLGDALSTGPVAEMYDSRFDVLSANRWHRLRIDTVGDFEMSRYEVDIVPAGKE